MARMSVKRVNNSPFFLQQMGDFNQSNSLKFTTLGLTAISIIIESLDINNNHIRFSNQQYSISVSNDDKDYTKLFGINLGYDFVTSNSLNEGFQSALYYRHLLITVPPLGDNKRSKISVSGK